jgi:hypothetical protein
MLDKSLLRKPARMLELRYRILWHGTTIYFDLIRTRSYFFCDCAAYSCTRHVYGVLCWHGLFLCLFATGILVSACVFKVQVGQSERAGWTCALFLQFHGRVGRASVLRCGAVADPRLYVYDHIRFLQMQSRLVIR